MSKRSEVVFARHGGRLIHAPNMGTVEVRTDENGGVHCYLNRELSQEELDRLEEWLKTEWSKRTG